MSSPRVERAQALAELLVAEAGIYATHDVEKADANRPCVLVQAPALTYDRPHPHASVAWRLLAIADGKSALSDWKQLDDLLIALEDVLELESAEPATFVLSPDSPPMPAYVITYLESL